MDNCGYPTVCGYGSKCVEALTKARGQNCESDFECVAGSACVNVSTEISTNFPNKIFPTFILDFHEFSLNFL